MLKELEGTGFRGGFILELARMADMQQMLVEARKATRRETTAIKAPLFVRADWPQALSPRNQSSTRSVPPANCAGTQPLTWGKRVPSYSQEDV